MKLSLSVRVAEKFLAKRQANMTLEQLATLATQHGYDALCIRASQLGTHSPPAQIAAAHTLLTQHKLPVSMLTGDFPIPENSDDEGPRALRNITPYLDLAEQLGAPLLRVCMKTAEDIDWARRAADEAASRNLSLVHQCHTRSLFEEVDHSLAVLAAIDRPNFGLIYEPANLELCGQAYGPETIRRFAPHIFNVYLQNQILTTDSPDALDTWCRGRVPFQQIPIWQEGGIDFPPLFDALREIDYQGYITIHQASAELGTEAAVKESARYLKGLGVGD
jgi:sugar phosphate isomerase/epimerase